VAFECPSKILNPAPPAPAHTTCKPQKSSVTATNIESRSLIRLNKIAKYPWNCYGTVDPNTKRKTNPDLGR